MKAAEFNAIYEIHLIRPLVAKGFTQQGTSLILIQDSSVLALIRHQNKWSSLLQFALFTVCVRHTFLRDLDKQPCDRFTKSIADYPFKIQPSLLSNHFVNRSWHYEPCNLGHWPQDEIHFGKASDVTQAIECLRQTVASVGISWLQTLDPTEAHRQILRYGESAYCEKIWLEDYTTHLAMPK